MQRLFRHQPAPRHCHRTVRLGDKLYVWGGLQRKLPVVCDGPEKERFTSVVDVFHLRSGCWQQRNTRGKPPRGVANYSCVAIGTRIFYFGGHCGHTECFHNNITALDTESMTWEELTPTSEVYRGEGPMKKNSCGMIPLPDNLLYIVGGVGKFPSTPPPQFQYTPQISGSKYGRTNEQHIFSLQTGE